MSDQPTEGNRPLNRLFKMAVMAGVEDSVRLHIQRGDDVNACDDKGLTPLMIAASRNRASTCRLLLDSGADARLLNAAGLDALTLAKLAGAHDAAKILESAIAIGYPHIRGYQQRRNFQRQALFDELIRQLGSRPQLEEAVLKAVDLPAEVPLVERFDGVQVEPPKLELKAKEPDAFRPPVLSHRDYLAREARNQSLGRAGEEFVVHYERWRLIQRGHERLADRIEHTSKARGDGAGYDVLSFEEDGRERFIEVKTTAYGKETPFFISDGELTFANRNEMTFRLYRVFEFRKAPHLFELRGRPDRHCRLDPTTYRASFS